MAVTDGFNELPPEEQETWRGQYGASAPFFWAAQSGNLQTPPGAEGFFNLPPEDQATWYGEYGEDAPGLWMQQSQQPGPGGAGSTAAPPVANNILKHPVVGAGRYADTYAGHTVRKGDPGKGAGIGFGQTVAPSTWNAADPSQGRSEGWGTIGAGTAGIQYGYGTTGFGKNLIKIDEKDLPHLSNPKVAPGYIPGSGTYNQYDLSQGGLFGTVKGSGSSNIVNTRYGLGGTGDPTTGHELQTPDRYISGNMSASDQPMQGDAMARGQGGGQSPYFALAPTGQGGGGGQGGGMEVQENQGGGQGGGFFTAGPGFSPAELGHMWGQPGPTQGLDYLVTLFMRSDTPTGVGTPAWSAPPEYWQGLLAAIRSGMVTVRDPGAWQMLAQKIPGTTPQSIGGSATSQHNIQPNGQPGTGATAPGAGGTGTPVNPQYGVGTLPEGTQTPFGPIQGGLPQGVGLEYHRILEDRARREAEMAVEQAKLTGVFNGMPTLQAKELEEKIKQNAFDNSIKTAQENRAQRQQDLDEAFRRTELDQNIAVKREEIENARRTGDLDRAQRETENLRLMEQQRAELGFKKETAVGYVGGQATVELQKFLADQQNEAYKRAANPAMAFENELARGATGWNTPGVSPTAAGVAGVTAPGQTLQQWHQAGGYAQNQQPGAGATQPYGYGFGTPGGTPTVGPGFGGTAQGAAGTPVWGDQAQAYQQQAGAQQQQATSAAQQKTAQAPAYQQAAQQTGAAAQATPDNPMMTTQQQPAGASAYGATAGGGGFPQQRMASFLAQGVAGGGGGMGGGEQNVNTPGYVAPTPWDWQQWGANINTPGVAPTPAVQPVLVRTPAVVQAFRSGSQMPTAGNYGVNNALLPANQAALTQRDVRTQNLKQTRKMAPAVRALIGSYAAAGGTDTDTFKYHGERKAPAAQTAGGSYQLK